MSDGKLVRDLIPDLIRKSGREPEVRRLTGDALVAALAAKLCEEAVEAAEAVGGTRAHLVEELADLGEVMAALMQAAGVTESEIAAAAARKAQERGRFNAGLWLVKPLG